MPTVMSHDGAALRRGGIGEGTFHTSRVEVSMSLAVMSALAVTKCVPSALKRMSLIWPPCTSTSSFTLPVCAIAHPNFTNST